MKGIADTGFLVAFANEDDGHHDWAVSVASRVTAPLLTCESVLSEAAYHLGSPSVVFRLMADGLVVLSFDCSEHLPRLTELARHYADRRPDFADLCLIRMSELHPRHPVFTVDRADFEVYRRNGREVIPLVCPPAR